MHNKQNNTPRRDLVRKWHKNNCTWIHPCNVLLDLSFSEGWLIKIGLSLLLAVSVPSVCFSAMIKCLIDTLRKRSFTARIAALWWKLNRQQSSITNWHSTAWFSCGVRFFSANTHTISNALLAMQLSWRVTQNHVIFLMLNKVQTFIFYAQHIESFIKPIKRH